MRAKVPNIDNLSLNMLILIPHLRISDKKVGYILYYSIAFLILQKVAYFIRRVACLRNWDNKVIKACVFDVGNTLMNDSKLMASALRSLAVWLKEKGILRDEKTFVNTYEKFNRALHRPHWSHTYGEIELFQRTLDKLGIREIEPEEVLMRYRWLIEEGTKPDPDVIEAFKFLRENGMKIALLTNERASRIEMFVRKTGIVDFLDAVVVSERVGVEKPHPLIFEEVRRRLEVEFSEMVIFGDSEITDGGGQELGMKFVLVKCYKDPTWDWGGGSCVKPDYVMGKVSKREIERCLKALEE